MRINVEPGLYYIFQWNGKDLFMQNLKEDFFVLSRQELDSETVDFLEHPERYHGRKIKITAGGGVELIKTPAELEEERIRKQAHARLLVVIAGIEATGDDMPEYAKVRLEELRRQLAEFEPMDPTALTIAQKRANASVWKKK